MGTLNSLRADWQGVCEDIQAKGHVNHRHWKMGGQTERRSCSLDARFDLCVGHTQQQKQPSGLSQKAAEGFALAAQGKDARLAGPYGPQAGGVSSVQLDRHTAGHKEGERAGARERERGRGQAWELAKGGTEGEGIPEGDWL